MSWHSTSLQGELLWWWMGQAATTSQSDASRVGKLRARRLSDKPNVQVGTKPCLFSAFPLSMSLSTDEKQKNNPNIWITRPSNQEIMMGTQWSRPPLSVLYLERLRHTQLMQFHRVLQTLKSFINHRKIYWQSHLMVHLKKKVIS